MSSSNAVDSAWARTARGRPRTIVVAGQTTPAHSGQAIAITGLLGCDLKGYRLVHVPMNFSKSMMDMNRGGLKKILVLGRLVVGLWWARATTGAEILCYPPAGPDVRPIVRDVVALLATRWCYRYTVLHFHAGGGMLFVERELGGILGRLARRAYARPDLSIRTSALAPRDDLACHSARDVVVDNFAEDISAYALTPRRADGIALLFIGVLCEEKGVDVLVEALGLVVARGVSTTLTLVGEFQSNDYRDELLVRIDALGLRNRVRLAGVLHGAAKARCLADADVFVFPSHFRSETFGLVLAEAMSAGKPIVTTAWRGIPGVVTHEREGLVVPIRDPGAVADAVAALAADPDRRSEMGRRGRETYERRFTIARFAKNIRAAFEMLPRRGQSAEVEL